MDCKHWRPDSGWPFRQEWLQILSGAFMENFHSFRQAYTDDSGIGAEAT
jgi:hypothetical protein